MQSKLIRWSGLALAGAGLANALFWLLALPFETFAGAHVVLHPLYLPGQVLHAVSPILAVFGYVGVYLVLREKTNRLSALGYIVAILGALMYFADAVIALVALPVLATHAPELLEASGPMFTGTVLGYYILFAATNMIGIILLGLAMLRDGRMPRLAVILFILGGILFNLPPMPALHLLLVAGGVVWGLGVIWTGLRLWQRAHGPMPGAAS